MSRQIAVLRVSALILCLFGTFGSIKAQGVSILNANVSAYNLTPRALLEVNISNSKSDVQVVMQAKIFTVQNEILMSVVSTPFVIKKGMNTAAQLNIGVASVTYASSNQATMIKTSHSLPSGKYTYCASITATDVSDEYCQDIESDFSSFLFLVSPPDKEEIETKYPVLIWTHSEPFSLSNQNEYYRMIVTELTNGQSAEGSVNTNVPVYMKNYLNSHQVLYPIDAKELQVGKTYAWQVQKMSGGAIVNKTEAWEFKIKAPDPIRENKYATMKKVLDGTIYTAENNKIFFRFDESYAENNLHYKIIDDKQNAVTAQQSSAKGDRVKMEAVKVGYNTFKIDLNKYKISAGVYVLEVTNDKRELYKLKFVVE